MPQNTSQLDGEAQRIIATYTILYKLIFKFGGIVIALVAAIIIFVVSIMSSSTTDISSPDAREDLLLRQAQRRLSVSTWWSSIRIESLLWLYSSTGWRVVSIGNLGLIGSFVLPNVTTIDVNTDFSTMRADIAWPEDIEIMKRRYDTIVFIFPPLGMEIPSPIQPLLVSSAGIIDQFSLSCIQWFKFFNGICSYYVWQFFDRFRVYRLSQHIQDLSEIQQSFDVWQRKRFCEWLLSYIAVTNDIAINIESLTSKCDPLIQQKIARASSLITLQKQLLNTQGSALINDEVFSDPLINGFKLVSAQQLLYQDFAVWRPDFSRIDGYLDLVQRLTKNPAALTWITFDMIYYFNTAYLAAQLINPAFSNTPDRTVKSTKSTNKLAEINKWSALGWFPALTTLLSSQSLPNWLWELQWWLNSTTWSIFSWSIFSWSTSTQEDLLRSYFRVPRFNIQQQTFSWSRATIAGIGKVSIQGDRSIQFPVSFLVSTTGQNVNIDSVEFSGYTNLTNTINNLIKQRSVSLSQIYDTVVSNAELFASNQTNQLLMCDVVRDWFPDSISSCSATGMVFSQQIEDRNVSYSFQMSWYEIRSVLVSLTGIQQLVNQQTIPTTTNLTLVNTIKSLLNLRVVVSDAGPTATTPIALITTTFQTYLWVKPTSIDETAKSGKYAIDTTIKGLVLRVQYDYPTSTIERILIVVWSNRIAVRNASFVLQESQKSDLNRFIQNPVEYLRIISPDSIAEYDKLTQ